eukprot:990442_1
MNYNIPESYIGNEDDAIARFAWNMGSELEIYSRSEGKWFDGKIKDIKNNDDDSEWLRIVYGKKTKSVQRFNEHIRPLSVNINESENNINQKQSLSSIISSIISFHYALNQKETNLIKQLNKRYTFRTK